MLEFIQEIIKDNSIVFDYDVWFELSMDEKVKSLKDWIQELQAIENNIANDYSYYTLKRRKELKSLIKDVTIFEGAYFNDA